MNAIIVQARMSSTRLPGKVLKKAAGQTFLEHIVNRLKTVKNADKLIIATSTDQSDDPIENEAEKLGLTSFRGSLNNLINRYYCAAVENHADVVIRITADCPLIDPAIVEFAIEKYAESPEKYDLITNRCPLTFPDGMDVDVTSIKNLEIANSSNNAENENEHTVPYFITNRKRIFNFEQKARMFDRIRLTLDYEEDRVLLTKLIEAIEWKDYSLQRIVDYLEKNQDIINLNSKYIQESGPYNSQFDCADMTFLTREICF